jgi:hypothetical protein
MKIVRIIILAVMLMLYVTYVYAQDCGGGVRYKDNGDGTVADCSTGLIWLKNAKCVDTSGGVKPDSKGRLSWYDAMKWVADLRTGLCGLTDGSSSGVWRLPSKAEWEGMVAYAKKEGYTDPALTNAAGTATWTDGDAFNNVQLVFYWSSTTYDGPWSALVHEMNKKGAAWGVTMMVGYMDYGYKSDHDNVWPVRGSN